MSLQSRAVPSQACKELENAHCRSAGQREELLPAITKYIRIYDLLFIFDSAKFREDIRVQVKIKCFSFIGMIFLISDGVYFLS